MALKSDQTTLAELRANIIAAAGALFVIYLATFVVVTAIDWLK